MGQFAAAILGETEDTWSRVLPEQTGIKYQPVHLVLYSGQTRSACGGARSAMGPFYCPIDKKVYLDLSFFAEMKKKLGGGGDFAYAYVIAHEIGHHVQDQLGTLSKMQGAEQRVSGPQRNAISVKIELQADCFAGVWAANSDQKDHFLQPGDVEKGGEHRQGDRRRHAAGGEPRPRRARQLHPRLLGAARALAEGGAAIGQDRELRHVRRRRPWGRRRRAIVRAPAPAAS